MSFTFEWDEEKARKNEQDHQVTFHEGATIFHDPHIASMHDPDHSEDEDRYISLGYSSQGRVLLVSYTDRGNNIRLISCRKATRREHHMYEKGLF